ncbi:MAG: hypothetical protein AAFY02_13905 [Pseudomonadota bacterium]
MSDIGINGAVERAGSNPLVKAWLQVVQTVIGLVVAALLTWTLGELIGLRNDFVSMQSVISEGVKPRLANAERAIARIDGELDARTRDRFTSTNAQVLEERLLAETSRLRMDLRRLAEKMDRVLGERQGLP